MAKVVSSLLPGISGAVGKQFVFKQYKGKTIVAKYPDMTNIKPSERQKERQELFKQAVAYAKGVNRDPVKKALYQAKVKPGQTVYKYALQEYFKINQERYALQEYFKINQERYALQEYFKINQERK